MLPAQWRIHRPITTPIPALRPTFESNELHFGSTTPHAHKVKKPVQIGAKHIPVQLKQFQKELHTNPEHRGYQKNLEELGFEEMGEAYRAQTMRARGKYTKILSQMTLDEFIAVHRRKPELGFVEESSDMLFEMYTLKALRRGLIPTDPKTLDQWVNEFFPKGPNPQHPQGSSTRQAKPYKNFHDFLNDVNRKLVEKNGAEKVDSFQTMISPEEIWKEHKAARVLQLITAKFLLMRSREPQFDPLRQSRHLLEGETDELKEKIKGDGDFWFLNPLKVARCLMLTLLSTAYTHFDLPASFFRKFLVGMVKHTAQLPKLQYADLMKTVYRKQFTRQEFDHYTYGSSQYQFKKSRKAVLKDFEAVTEAFVIHRVLKRNHPPVSS